MSSRFIMPFADVGSGIKPSSGAKLFFFELDGVTPKNTFSDQLSTPTTNTNPVISDSNGVFGDIYITGSYKVTLQNKNGSQIFGGAIVEEFGGFDNLTVSYEFKTVNDMKNSAIIFPIGKRLSTGVGKWEVVTEATTTPLAGGVYAKLLNRVGAIDFGADDTGVTDSSVEIQAMIDAGHASIFSPGIYTVGTQLVPISGMDLFANGDAEIISTISTIPLSYNQIFKTPLALSNITVKGLKFSTAEDNFNVFGFDLQVTNLRLEDNECEGCGLVTTFKGAVNVNVEDNFIHSPSTEGGGSVSPYARPIQFNCLFTGTGSSNIKVMDNIILGSWTHGIEVSGNDVQDETDPLQPKNINGVVISGNIVKSLAQVDTAGAIWWSQAADVTVTNNYCALYGDVGIDCEASRNVTVTGNVLTDNNKNLAMYGNSNTVIFSDNACYNTISNLDTFYSKPANENSGASTGTPGGYWVDHRNTNIKITDNIFHYKGVMTGFEKVVIGSGGDVTFKDNKVINTRIEATSMSLTNINILDNDINNNGDFSAVGIGQSYATGDTNTSTFNAAVKRNKIVVSNGGIGIAYTDGDTVGASVDFNKILNITDNEIQIDTVNWGVLVNIAATITPTKTLNSTVLRNEVWGVIEYLESGNRTINKNVNDNTKLTGSPYSQTRTNAGVVNTFESTFLDTTAGVMSVSLADGDYNGQVKRVTMSADGGDATMIIATHRLGINQNAIFSAIGQYALLQWNVNAWDTIATTAAGI